MNIVNSLISLKVRVMARIYLEYARSILAVYPDYFMLLVFIVTALATVSVMDVVANTPKDDMSGAISFFVGALRNTNLIIQALIAGFFVRVGISGTKSVYRSVKSGQLLMKFKY